MSPYRQGGACAWTARPRLAQWPPPAAGLLNHAQRGTFFAAKGSHRDSAMPRNPSHTDVSREIGVRIRQRRMLLGLSQKALGALIGVSFQQIQKYERGADAPHPERLIRLTQALAVPITFFFDELASEQPSVVAPALTIRDLRLLRRLQNLPHEVRIAVERLVSMVAGEPEDERSEVPDAEFRWIVLANDRS